MRNDYDELETYNHDNNDYNEYNRQTTMTYDDLNRLISSKVRGSMIWMVIGLLITGGIGFMVYNGVNNGNSVAFMIVEKYWIFLIFRSCCSFSLFSLSLYSKFECSKTYIFNIFGIERTDVLGYWAQICSRYDWFSIFRNVVNLCSFSSLWIFY